MKLSQLPKNNDLKEANTMVGKNFLFVSVLQLQMSLM